ncbi:hypothetical protein K523DRAFT_232437 [Schizophyllum commune Tattone D]|nr:hypothetical protein K523DRAFT_232437 [Schizophyllum commune Tattone D]
MSTIEATQQQESKKRVASTETPAEGDHRKKRRNRTTQSCLNCHTSKRMCDRKRPACGRCTQLGLTGHCVYEVDDPAQRAESDENARLLKRVAELEGVIRELKNKPQPRRPRTDSQTSEPCIALDGPPTPVTPDGLEGRSMDGSEASRTPPLSTSPCTVGSPSISSMPSPMDELVISFIGNDASGTRHPPPTFSSEDLTAQWIANDLSALLSPRFEGNVCDDPGAVPPAEEGGRGTFARPRHHTALLSPDAARHRVRRLSQVRFILSCTDRRTYFRLTSTGIR